MEQFNVQGKGTNLAVAVNQFTGNLGEFLSSTKTIYELQNTELQNTELQNTELQNTELQNTELQNTDRVVNINNFRLCVHDDYRTNRRNVICHSDKLQLYMTSNNLSGPPPVHWRNNPDFDDIKIIRVDGYY